MSIVMRFEGVSAAAQKDGVRATYGPMGAAAVVQIKRSKARQFGKNSNSLRVLLHY